MITEKEYINEFTLNLKQNVLDYVKQEFNNDLEHINLKAIMEMMDKIVQNNQDYINSEQGKYHVKVMVDWLNEIQQDKQYLMIINRVDNFLRNINDVADSYFLGVEYSNILINVIDIDREDEKSIGAAFNAFGINYIEKNEINYDASSTLKKLALNNLSAKSFLLQDGMIFNKYVNKLLNKFIESDFKEEYSKYVNFIDNIFNISKATYNLEKLNGQESFDVLLDIGRHVQNKVIKLGMNRDSYKEFNLNGLVLLEKIADHVRKYYGDINNIQTTLLKMASESSYPQIPFYKQLILDLVDNIEVKNKIFFDMPSYTNILSKKTNFIFFKVMNDCFPKNDDSLFEISFYEDKEEDSGKDYYILDVDAYMLYFLTRNAYEETGEDDYEVRGRSKQTKDINIQKLMTSISVQFSKEDYPNLKENEAIYLVTQAYTNLLKTNISDDVFTESIIGEMRKLYREMKLITHINERIDNQRTTKRKI